MEENNQSPATPVECPVVEVAKDLEAKNLVDLKLLNEETTKLQKELEAKLLALEGLVKSVEARLESVGQAVHSRVQEVENFLKRKFPYS